jgi:hypothetical protein
MDHWFRGYMVGKDLAGRATLAGLMGLGINGRRLTDDEAGMLDDIAVAWTSADPRIWPLKVSRLASSFGGTIQGIAAALLCMDCHVVGIWESSLATARWLGELRESLRDCAGDPERVAQAARDHLGNRRFIPGFGVPYRVEDERVPPMWRCLANRGRDRLPNVHLFEQVGDVVRRERGIGPNVTGLATAICLDLGFAPDEIGSLLIYLATPMIIANAHEGARQAPAVLQRLPDDRVRYIGPAPRVSPRARGADRGEGGAG